MFAAMLRQYTIVLSLIWSLASASPSGASRPRADPPCCHLVSMGQAGNATLAGDRRSRAFRSLWFGESVSLLGDQVDPRVVAACAQLRVVP
jgi:hypothetical protein